MKLSEFKNHLEHVGNLHFELPGGNLIPAHFHITEAGLVTKHFIDCGGTIRSEKSIHFQIWVSTDIHHRLQPSALQKIITISQPVIGTDDLEVEIEYQTETLGLYRLEFDRGRFVLNAKATNCLASDQCGTSSKKSFVEPEGKIRQAEACCTPGGACC